MEIDPDIEGGDCFEAPAGVKESAASMLFSVASLLTDPICKAHQLWRRISTVNSLHLNASGVEIFARKGLYGIGMVAFGALGIATAPLGIVLRKIAIWLQSENYRYVRTRAAEKTSDETFSLYLHNLAAVGAGYSISDGGVMPWPDRYLKIVEQIKAISADIFVGVEFSDTQLVDKLSKDLGDEYAHIYHSCGKRAIGPCSDLFIASKLPIKNFKFTPFPKGYVSGRSKHSSRGFVEIWLKNGAYILATHLQHSEEPEPPKGSDPRYEEEQASRKKQMQLIQKRIAASGARTCVLAGDLNMAEKPEWWKYAESFTRDPGIVGKVTWCGDEWCAKMVGGNKRTSSPLTLDYTALWRGIGGIKTEIVKTTYNPKVFNPDALSDHYGLLSQLKIM